MQGCGGMPVLSVVEGPVLSGVEGLVLSEVEGPVWHIKEAVRWLRHRRSYLKNIHDS